MRLSLNKYEHAALKYILNFVLLKEYKLPTGLKEDINSIIEKL